MAQSNPDTFGANPSPLVSCPAGALQGFTSEGVERFYAIPYAYPPVGPLRFAPAKPLAGWEKVLDATRFGPASAQVFSPEEARPEDYGGDEGMEGFGLAWAGSEDCLTLNIWRPADVTGPLPVIIWIHGGANAIESSRFGFYDGSAIAREGAVFVSLNYRLGIFGFLDLSPIGGPEQAHSHGLTDQLAAIDWVVKNIAAFAGDPSNITLMGNSAGSMDISWLIASGRLPPGVRRAILSSGIASPAGVGRDGTSFAHGPDEGHRRAAEFLAGLGYSSFADLQAASTGEILTRQAALSPRLSALPDMETLFYPRTGTFAALDPFAAVAAGQARGLDVMIGFTAYEMGFYLLADDDFDRRSVDQVAELIPFVPALARDRLPALYRHWFPDATDGQRGMHLLSDAVFAIPALWFAELASANGASVYAYRFDWAVDARVGAVHAADVAFMLGVEDTSDAALLIGHPSTAENRTQRRNLAEQMTGAVASFAANGAPTVQGRKWPAYAADRRQMILFDVSPRTAEDPIHERREWWTANVLPTAFGGGAR